MSAKRWSVWATLVLAGCGSGGWGRGSEEPGRLSAGQTVRSDTSDDADDWEPSCGETGGGGDEAWLLEPEVTGVHHIRLVARYDAVLAVAAGDPGGAELGCNDDLEGTAISELRLRLERGRSYAVIVDGYRGDAGEYELSVEAEDEDGDVD